MPKFCVIFLILFLAVYGNRNNKDRVRKGRGYRKYIGKAKQTGKRDPNNPNGKEYFDLNPEQKNKRMGYHELDCETGKEYEYEYDIGVNDEWENDKRNDNKGAKGNDDSNDSSEDSMRRLAIQGTDGRFENYGAPPTSTLSEYVGLLLFSDGSISYYCTATLIDWTWIITAAHCVHEGQNGNCFVYYCIYV